MVARHAGSEQDRPLRRRVDTEFPARGRHRALAPAGRVEAALLTVRQSTGPLPGALCVSIVVLRHDDGYEPVQQRLRATHVAQQLTRWAQRRCPAPPNSRISTADQSPTDPVLAAREERLTDLMVACRLMVLDELQEALAWTRRPSEAADLLWVDHATLHARLESLGEEERARIEARLADLYQP